MIALKYIKVTWLRNNLHGQLNNILHFVSFYFCKNFTIICLIQILTFVTFINGKIKKIVIRGKEKRRKNSHLF